MNSLFALSLFFRVSLHLELSLLTTIRDCPPYLGVKQTRKYTLLHVPMRFVKQGFR